MRVISFRKLREFFERDRRAEIPMKMWYKRTEKAEWNNFKDIKKDFNSVDPVGNPLDLLFDEQYYFGVEVGSDGEMTPRQAMTSVPSAFYSLHSDSAVNADLAVNADMLDGQHSGAFASSSHSHSASGSRSISPNIRSRAVR